MSLNLRHVRPFARGYAKYAEPSRSRISLEPSGKRRAFALAKGRRLTSRYYADLQALSTFSTKHDPSPSDTALGQLTVADDLRYNAQTKSWPAYGSRKSKALPITCPGCGAFSQESSPHEAGYCNRNRRAVRQYLKTLPAPDAVQEPAQDAHHDHPTTTGLDFSSEDFKEEVDVVSPDSIVLGSAVSTPMCDRCHDISHASHGQSIVHPSVEALIDTIAESPYSRNHIYHVLDAADFPMSLIPSLHDAFDIARPRSQNRRARHKFTSKPTVSFLITRSDLLAPTKELVDNLLPYFQVVLRTALGRSVRNARLGNVHLVSAKRGWWTTGIKEEIWNRGHGNWMLGKVNVGKSNLFEVLFPKGSGERAPVYAEIAAKQAGSDDNMNMDDSLNPFVREDSLLPPPQPETPFPILPLVSSLPGTTASPIRLSFGNRRGELIDLPGLARGNLENYVADEHKKDLIMQYRPKVEQFVIKPGQSLLLGGGLVRITPQFPSSDPRAVMLAYPFVPLRSHLTSTEKATSTQLQQRVSGIDSILAAGVGNNVISAGQFRLATDVTRAHAGTILRAGVSLDDLPFAIHSTDILVEGVGWVELVCQVRRRPNSARSQAPISAAEVEQPPSPEVPQGSTVENIGGDGFKPYSVIQDHAIAEDAKEPLFPSVEVFTPGGKHIAQRRSLGAWALWTSKKKTQKGQRQS